MMELLVSVHLTGKFELCPAIGWGRKGDLRGKGELLTPETVVFFPLHPALPFFPVPRRNEGVEGCFGGRGRSFLSSEG